ncbi:MAG: hypothetical protein RL662_115 [Bacteroidota bacterium]|jgi:hypothetical protein
MILNLLNDNNKITYDFIFRKKHIYKKTIELSSDTNGTINLQRKESEKFQDCCEYLFKYKNFISKDVEDPLLFDPIIWIFNLKLNAAGINSKEDLKLLWNKYKNKYRSHDNIVKFSTLENLYFKALFGMEYMFFSNSPFLVFFINYYNMEILEGATIKGLDFLLMPMSIPVNTWYKCRKIDEKHISLDGWLTLDDDKLERLITQKQFLDKAKSYHFSKDFRLESKINVCIDIKTSALHTASFKLDINGEEGKLKEEMYYEIKSNLDLNPNEGYIVGRPRFLDGKR